MCLCSFHLPLPSSNDTYINAYGMATVKHCKYLYYKELQEHIFLKEEGDRGSKAQGVPRRSGAASTGKNPPLLARFFCYNLDHETEQRTHTDQQKGNNADNEFCHILPRWLIHLRYIERDMAGYPNCWLCVSDYLVVLLCAGPR